MKTLQVPKNEIETEAEDHAEETRYAVTHHGKELHRSDPEQAPRQREVQAEHEPWQVD